MRLTLPLQKQALEPGPKWVIGKGRTKQKHKGVQRKRRVQLVTHLVRATHGHVSIAVNDISALSSSL